MSAKLGTELSPLGGPYMLLTAEASLQPLMWVSGDLNFGPHGYKRVF